MISEDRDRYEFLWEWELSEIYITNPMNSIYHHKHQSEYIIIKSMKCNYHSIHLIVQSIEDIHFNEFDAHRILVEANCLPLK